MQDADSAAAYPLTTGTGRGDLRNAYAIHTWLEGSNAFGVPIRTWYRCVVSKNATGGEWIVVSYDKDELGGLLASPGLHDTTVVGTTSLVSTADSLKPSASVTPISLWFVNEDTSRIDGSRSISLHLSAVESLQTRYGQAHPSIVIRCRDSRTDVFVVAGTMLQSDYYSAAIPVRTRFDGAAAKRERWNESDNREAAFAPRPISFAKALAAADSFFIELSLLDSGAQTAVFAVAGLQQELPKVAKACDWPD